jgi:hypothetical protein
MSAGTEQRKLAGFPVVNDGREFSIGRKSGVEYPFHAVFKGNLPNFPMNPLW